MAPTPERSELLPTYHGKPALKPSVYGWTVAFYIFIGGLAGATQVIATAADLIASPGANGIILGGRVIALAGAILGGILLIMELHTKQRFINMLRIIRLTSPMSIGTYVLMSFGFWSLAALACGLAGPHWLTLIFACLAAIAGWFMMTYTASLLGATSTPLWASAPGCLAVRFAASAMASGAAALCLIALALGSPEIVALGNIAGTALVIELVASIAALVIYVARGVASPLFSLPWGAVHLVGVQVAGTALPIALYVLGNTAHRFELFLLFASLCTLGGGILMRGTLLLAGNESARRAGDYFRFARQYGA